MPTDRELDGLIDAALPSYSASEPQHGLERRILSLAIAESQTKRSFVWAWALAVPAILCCVFFLVVSSQSTLPRKAPAPRATVEIGTASPPPSKANIGATTISEAQPKAVPSRPKAASRPVTGEPLPKKDVFPSSAPLTVEEQTLLAYNSAQIRAAKANSSRELEIDPIHIAELNINPVTIPSLDVSEADPNDRQP